MIALVNPSNISLVIQPTPLTLNFTSTTTNEHSKSNISWFEIIIPLMCILGILGNLFSIIVLTRRRMVSSLDRIGRSAYRGLVALALSDLLFCVTVLPHAFIPLLGSLSMYGTHFSMLYSLYGISLINLTMMTSTWLVVMTAFTRYRVVMRPLEARIGYCATHTSLLIAAVCFISITLSLPYFLHTSVSACFTPGVGRTWEYTYVFKSRTTAVLQFYIRWVWPVFADFIPICILIFCNVMLVHQLRTATVQRRHTCPGQNVHENSKRITVTLVSIILMQLLLVTPSELLKYVNPYAAWGKTGHIIAQVTNVMQTLNFASNFLMYLVVNVSFRKTVMSMFFDKCKSKSFYRNKSSTRTIYGSSSYISLRKFVKIEVNDDQGEQMTPEEEGDSDE